MMDSNHGVVRDGDPRYDLDNTTAVELPIPPVPRPDSSADQVRDFLCNFFAHTYSISPDHLFVQDLVARFDGDGRALYSSSSIELRQMFGHPLGQDLDTTLSYSEYGWSRTVALTTGYVSRLFSFQGSFTGSLSFSQETMTRTFSSRSPQLSGSSLSGPIGDSSSTPATRPRLQNSRATTTGQALEAGGGGDQPAATQSGNQ